MGLIWAKFLFPVIIRQKFAAYLGSALILLAFFACYKISFRILKFSNSTSKDDLDFQNRDQYRYQTINLDKILLKFVSNLFRFPNQVT